MTARLEVSGPTLSLALSLLLAGCVGLGTVHPDSPLARARGMLAMSQFDEAREAFGALVREAPEDPRAQLGLGAAYEGLGHLDSARVIYEALEGQRLPRSVRGQLDGRVRLLHRRELHEAARRAIAEEVRLTNLAPEPNTIGVMPFRYEGSDTALRPLERALAHFVITDLSRVSAVRVLERQAVQVLLDELRLVQSGRVDPATGARSGRLLRAEHVLQGDLLSLAGVEDLKLSARAVRTATVEIAGEASAQDELRQLFDMEKAVVLGLLGEMRVAITEAERELIMERPTASIQALLEFGRGLEAEDAGNLVAARRAFRRARSEDPGFRAAAEEEQAAENMMEADQTTLPGVAELLDVLLPADLPFLADNLNEVMGNAMSQGDQAETPSGETPPGGRDGVGEVGGQDQFPLIRVFIRIRRP